jgi:hypothetical protein
LHNVHGTVEIDLSFDNGGDAISTARRRSRVPHQSYSRLKYSELEAERMMTYNCFRWLLCFSLTMVAVLGVGVLPASAQATRTWVSGVGDDANPCSRTAPCKTFAGAISKTAAGGEINALDPGGFGAVTITKAITIQAVGVEAGVLVSGTNGIVVSAGVGDNVNLVGLDFEGLGTGLDGVVVLSGALVHIHNCNFRHFTSAGVHVLPNPSNGGPSYVLVTDSIFDGNDFGVATFSTTPAAAATAFVDHVTIMGKGLGSGSTGIAVDGGSASLVMTNSTVVRNQTGLAATNGAQLFSFGNNRVVQNQVNGAPNQSDLGFQ